MSGNQTNFFFARNSKLLGPRLTITLHGWPFDPVLEVRLRQALSTAPRLPRDSPNGPIPKVLLCLALPTAPKALLPLTLPKWGAQARAQYESGVSKRARNMKVGCASARAQYESGVRKRARAI